MIRDKRPEVIDHLCKDKKLAKVINQCFIQEVVPKHNDVYGSLINSIVSQQLSITAAKTIYDRFVAGLDKSLSPSQQVLTKSIDELRSYGLSNGKANYIQNVARYFEEHDLFDADWTSMSNEEIIDQLTQIKGVGKWTVEMILMFSLMREDVLPLDDLIIRNHMIVLYGVDITQKKALYEALEKKAEKWRPYRSIACRYLWAGKGLDIFKI
jgi:DNA-3-methyladenine glycosylase II